MIKVAVLLSTYNGEKYLLNQLQSIQKQTAKNFHIYIRDDGSTDRTTEIIEKFCENNVNCSVLQSGRNLGAANSFMELLKLVDEEYYMFCDQDDIWLKNKIKNSLDYLLLKEKGKKGVPVLIYTDAKVVDVRLNTIAESFIDTSGIVPDLVQKWGYVMINNVAPGCTYIFNKELRKIAVNHPSDLPMHDWWMVLNAERYGELYFLNSADILYRQHDNNVIGVHEANLKQFLNKFIKLNDTLNNQLKQYRFLKAHDFISSIFVYYYLKCKFILKARFK